VPVLEQINGIIQFIEGLNMKVCTVYGNKQYSTKASAHKMMLITGSSVVAKLSIDYYSLVRYISTNTRYCLEQQLNSLNTHVKNLSSDQECTRAFNFLFSFSPSEYYSAWHLIMPAI
jgi:N12 class adenine-specific DNA methylase